MNTPDTSVIERIQKLYRKAESARQLGNLAEAEAFMDGVMKTLAKHKLDMTVVNLPLEDTRNPMGHESLLPGGELVAREEHWEQLLSDATCTAHYCRSLRSLGFNKLVIVGRKEDRKVAAYMFRFFYDMALRMLRERGGTYPHPDRRSEGWLFGFACAVARRYTEKRRRLETDTGYQLVRVRNDQEIRSEFQRLGVREDLPPQDFEAVLQGKDYAASLLGWRDGHTVSLDPGNVVGETEERRRLQ